MEIQRHCSLSSYNTFGVNQYAERCTVIQSITTLLEARSIDPHPYILGGGSNILLTKDLDRLVLKNELKGKTILYEDEDKAIVQLMSGESWHECVRWAVLRGWGGIENLSLIPGTVGAAPIQNIGAYGSEIKDVVREVTAIDLHSGDEIIFSNRDCKFGYRDSCFKTPANKGRYFIIHVLIELSKNPIPNARYADIEKKLNEKNIIHPTILDIHEAVMEVRQFKLPDPAVLGNAGSFFKNPVISMEQYDRLKALRPDSPHYAFDASHVKIPAGWLIDQAGWKGRSIGQVGCYERQALVIVNKGGASGDEIWNFAQLVSKDVLDKFEIKIEPEINIW